MRWAIPSASPRARHRRYARGGACRGGDRPRDGDERRQRSAAQRCRRRARGGGMSFVQTVVAFIVALGVLIVVHEYGHYLVARLCKVKVLRFPGGFGRPLALWRLGPDRTEWVIAAIPFGGYVKMLDEREGPVQPAELARAFNRQSVWKRFAIVIAGPLFNFVFAVLVYAGLFMYGLPEARPLLGAPPPKTLAATAGFNAGDTVRAIDGEPITTWQGP